jgi:uncharacterized protein YcfJ
VKATIISCAIIALAGCTTLGPTAAVMPGPHKTFEAFQADQAECTQYSDHLLAGAADTYNKSQIGTMVVGTVLGAGLGGAIGGGHGAGIGAASGAIAGTAVAGVDSNRELGTLQRRYDIAYSQCMYAKGNRVPAI